MLLILFCSCYKQNFEEVVNPVTTSDFEVKQKLGIGVEIKEISA